MFKILFAPNSSTHTQNEFLILCMSGVFHILPLVLNNTLTSFEIVIFELFLKSICIRIVAFQSKPPYVFDSSMLS